MKFLDVPQSGSWAGVTSSRNRYGQYRRTRAIPVNPNTGKQSAARALLVQLTKNWSNLSQADQTSWSAYAAAHPKQDRLGQSIILSGNAQYVAFNFNIVFLLANPPVDTAPTGGGGIVLPIPVYTVQAVGGLATALSVGFDIDPMPAGQIASVFAGKCQSAGVSFDKDLRYLGNILPGDTPSPNDYTTEYLATWGSITTGGRVFYRIDTYNVNGPLANSIGGYVVTT